MVRRQLRGALREIALRYPGLQRFSGRLGLGRLLAPAATCEQLTLDGDIVVELDMSVPIFRYMYFHHDLASMDEVVLLRRLLRAEDVVVDAGAHIGIFSLAAAKYSHHVHAFEISPSTIRYLQRNLALNPALAAKVTVHELGLGAEVGQFTLYNSAGHPGTASLQPLAGTDVFTETVALTTLDKHLAGTPIAWIKIDVEGGELAVLRGAAQHLDASRPTVLLELFEPFQQRAGASCAEVEAFMRARDYTGFLLESHADGSRRRGVVPHLTPLQVDRLNRVEVSNALFVPRERAAAVREAVG